ncbi:hypothetical protein DFH29DRAFT_876898 [Suillus ampliporus]|nr:hypothetical protein DFH29DRAFT_876898 [Suillus ampliporus]
MQIYCYFVVEICAEWKWFADLDAIWHSNPAFAVTSHSSRPGVDHAGQMYSLVQPPHGTAATGTSRHSRGAARVQPQASCSASAQSFHGDPPIDPYLLQPSPALPDTPATPTPPNDIPDIPDPVTPHCDPPPQVHLCGLSHTGNDLDRADPFTSPLGDALDHVQDDNMMQDDDDGMQDDDDEMQDETVIPNSPPKVAGKKRRIFSSPSPSPPPDPQPFHVPEKAPTTTYHSCAAFTQLDGGKKKKKAKSDMQDQVENLTEEIGSMQSDVMSLHDSKHQRFIAKLEAKSENQHETKKYDWLRDTRAHEASQAVLTHQQEQENRAAEIRLREVDIRVHEAHSAVLDKEAENMRLRIQYQQLVQGGSGST